MDMSTNKQLRPFGMRDKIGYAFGDFGCNMSFAFINSYLMLFYVTCMKIDPKHFAVLILLGKIFDAINDPIIGGLCDATKPGKDGKFKPWIKWASRCCCCHVSLYHLCTQCALRGKDRHVPGHLLPVERGVHQRECALRLHAKLHYQRPGGPLLPVPVAEYRRYVCPDSHYDPAAPAGI